MSKEREWNGLEECRSAGVKWDGGKREEKEEKTENQEEGWHARSGLARLGFFMGSGASPFWARLGR